MKVVIQNINDLKNKASFDMKDCETVTYAQNCQPDRTMKANGVLYMYYSTPFEATKDAKTGTLLITKPKGDKDSGWFEKADHTGKAPKHQAVARAGKLKDTLRTPMSKQSEEEWVEGVLVNDETATDTQMIDHFMANGLSKADAEFYVSQRSDALRNPLGFKLKPKTKHRKLTEKERDRMMNMWASAPLTYKPEIDDGLMKLGLVHFWDNMPDAVENTDMPFYGADGGVLPEWYDWKEETRRIEARKAKRNLKKPKSNFKRALMGMTDAQADELGAECAQYKSCDGFCESCKDKVMRRY